MPKTTAPRPLPAAWHTLAAAMQILAAHCSGWRADPTQHTMTWRAHGAFPASRLSWTVHSQTPSHSHPAAGSWCVQSSTAVGVLWLLQITSLGMTCQFLGMLCLTSANVMCQMAPTPMLAQLR